MGRGRIKGVEVREKESVNYGLIRNLVHVMSKKMDCAHHLNIMRLLRLDAASSILDHHRIKIILLNVTIML